MRFVLLLSLCLGCASGAPTTYNQSAFRPPPPPTLRPGVGLPQPHMPGQHVAPGIQPNPRSTRYLPPSREPGIWGTEAPKAADDSNDGWRPPKRIEGEPVPVIQIADVVIPTVSEARDAVDTISTEQCAYMTRLTILDAKIWHKMQKLSPQERACLIASAMSACQTWLPTAWLATIETARKAGISLDEDPADRFHYGRLAILLMAKWREQACSVKGADTQLVEKYRLALAEAAERLQFQGQDQGEVH